MFCCYILIFDVSRARSASPVARGGQANPRELAAIKIIIITIIIHRVFRF